MLHDFLTPCSYSFSDPILCDGARALIRLTIPNLANLFGAKETILEQKVTFMILDHAYLCTELSR